MKKLICLLGIVLFLSSSSYSQDAEYKKLFKKMYQTAGMERAMLEAMDNMLDLYKNDDKKNNDMIDKFKEEIHTSGLEDLIDRLLPVYYKYYSVEDLEALIRFYESPAGKKMLINLPSIMKESMEIGKDWGEKIGEKIAKDLK